MRGYRLTVACGEKVGILFASGFCGGVHKIAVEVVAEIYEAVALRRGGFELRFDCLVALAIPVGTKIFAHVLYRANIVVADHYISVGCLHVVEFANYRHRAFVVGGFVDARHTLAGNKFATESRRFAYAIFDFGLRCSQIEVSPVDCHMVATFGEHGLFGASGAEVCDSVLLIGFCLRSLMRLSKSPAGRCLEVNLNVVCLAVVGACLVVHIIHRAAENVEVTVEEHRSCKRYLEVDRAAGKCIMSLCGLHVGRCLNGSLREIRVERLGNQQTEVEQTEAYGVDTLCRKHIGAAGEGSACLGGEFDYTVFVTARACVVYFNAVDVENGIVVVGKLQVNGHFGRKRIGNFYSAAHPYFACVPFGAGCGFIFGAESAGAGFPCCVIEANHVPARSRTACCPAALPLALLRCGHKSLGVFFFSAHESVGFAVDFDNTDKRK